MQNHYILITYTNRFVALGDTFLRNGFLTSSCWCLRSLFHPAIHLYLFPSAMLSFCHFNMKKCWLSKWKPTNCHHYYYYIEGGFSFSKYFLVILEWSFPFHPNTKQQTPFWRKAISIKISIKNIFNSCEIQASLERAVNHTTALAIQEHYSCEWLSNKLCVLSINYRAHIYPVGNPKTPWLIKKMYLSLHQLTKLLQH